MIQILELVSRQLRRIIDIPVLLVLFLLGKAQISVLIVLVLIHFVEVGLT